MTLNEDDDFGFSAVSEEELRKYENELKAAVDETTTTAVELEDRLANFIDYKKRVA
jgi:predicted DNA-binding ArsR family transcriptional regulator